MSHTTFPQHNAWNKLAKLLAPLWNATHHYSNSCNVQVRNVKEHHILVSVYKNNALKTMNNQHFGFVLEHLIK